MNEMPHRILNILGVSAPAGITVLSLVENLNPILQCIGFLLGIGVAITAIALNIYKTKQIKKQSKILDKIDNNNE